MTSTFPAWVFDNSPIEDTRGDGAKAVEFLRRLRHPLSTEPKKAFQVNRPIERMTQAICGPRNPDGTRKVKTVFYMVGRGNRKTSTAAAWSLLSLLGPEATPAGQVIFAANDREQAGIGFREAANIIREDRRLINATKINDAFNSAKQIKNLRNGATLKAVSSDGRAQHGTTPNFILIDEIHAWQNRDLFEALDSGMVKVRDPLMIICTTAGRGQDSIGFEKYDYARKVATGEIIDPTFLPILFQAEPGDDWEDERVWEKANPGLPFGFLSLDGLRNKAREAKSSPPARYQFEQLHLNIWQAASRDPLFDMNVYDEGAVEHFDTEELIELPCYIGVDLSRSGDLTAIVAAWKHPDGTTSIFPWFYLPEDGLEEKARLEQMPYLRWRDEGHLDVIERPAIDPDKIADKLIELCATYDVREIAFDPTFGGPIMQKLMDHAINVVQQPQSAKAMTGPICDLERVVNGRRLRHSGHPILRSHLDGVVVKRSTNAGQLVTMHKGTRNTNHIDGAVAAAIAVSRATMNDGTKSLFETEDINEIYEQARKARA